MNPWRFLCACDMQPGSPRSFRFRRQHRENWERALEQLCREEADLMLVGGDLTRDGSIHDFEYEELKSELGSLPYPFYAVPGNMDTGNKHAEIEHRRSHAEVTGEQLDRFAQFYGAFPWSFIHENVRFSGMYAALAGSGLPHEERMWRWLEDELPALPRADHHVLIMHYALFINDVNEETWDLTDASQYHSWYFSIDKPDRLRIFEAMKASGVEIVLSGHIHCRRPEQVFDGVRFFKCAGIAFPQWPDRWPDGDPTLGYHRFEVTDSGIAETFVPLEQESTSDEGFGPGGHPDPEERDYSLAWEEPPAEFLT
ncbi:MAG: metallophosphoesterase family protein [Armatimonadota bacterium]|jgi:3',5'-cyclic AMP phosphodiesterase CpdA